MFKSERIDNLIKYLSEEDGYGRLPDFKDVQLVIKSLEELNAMIGNKKLKDHMAMQISHIIQSRGKEKTPSSPSPMLHTILYGPPGTGKTEIGKILAKIFYGMGYFKNNKSARTSFDELTNNSDSNDIILYAFLFYIALSVLFLVSEYLGWWPVIILVILGIAFIVWWFGTTTKTEVIASEDSLLKIVSREDFIGQYLGWTTKKTKKLLDDNRGKVLFIDEAYSLINGIHDQYGMEALTTLNRYLSEHPNEILVIFAGYKEDMQNGIFYHQPGLKRRCMWHLEIEPYDYVELFEIFKVQLSKSGYTLKHPNKTLEAFRNSYHLFSGYGGDCERLKNYVLLEHNDEKINNALGVEDEIIHIRQIVKGMEMLRQNRI